MKTLIAVLVCSLSAFGQQQGFRVDSMALGPKGPLNNVTITVCTGTATGTPCSPQATTFSDITLGTACSPGFQVTLPGSNLCQATSDALGNYGFWLAPGTYIYSVTGSNITGKNYTITVPVVADSSGNVSVAGTLTVAGTSTLANVTMGVASTLTTNNIRQAAGAGFNMFDPNGADHFFISASAPYVNTFLAGNGAGSIFLGSAALASVADTTGTISTAGSLILQTTSQTLPANIRNDTAGGITFTNNAGGSFQFGNGGTIFMNVLGGGIRWSGATSGTTVVQASAIAGSTTLTLPGGVNDTLVAKTTTDTLTNKRIAPRVVILTTSTTLTPDGDNSDISQMQMTGVTGTLTIAAPTGTPVNGQKLIVKIIATNSQTYSFNATYHFSTTTTAPTTIGAGKTDYLGCIWNSTNTAWDVVAVDQGH